ncbi:MAG: DegV family protein, partial [Clostridia bacterium]
MTKFTLSTDSSCDELKNNLKKVDIHYIPLVYIYNDEAFEDNFTTQEEYQFFYNEEKQSKFFTTAGLNPAMLEEYFENLLKEHKMDVVHVSLSSGISGSFDIAQTVVQRLNEKNENKIYLIDSKSATSGTKLVLNLARKCRDDEMTAKATADFVNEKIKSMTTNFFVCDLDHLRRGGRLSSFQAVIGKML